MNISKMASTVILATAFATIFLFSIIFYLYGGVYGVLKDALSMTASFFGGIATLVAAYIATQLFNDWKEQHNKNIEKDLVLDVISKFDNADFNLSEFYESYNFFKLKVQEIYKLSDEEFKNLNLSLSEIVKKLNGVSLAFSTYEEALRKYSLLSDSKHHSEAKDQLKVLYKSILLIQRLEIVFPKTLDDIDIIMPDIKHAINGLESNINNYLLIKVKA